MISVDIINRNSKDVKIFQVVTEIFALYYGFTVIMISSPTIFFLGFPVFCNLFTGILETNRKLHVEAGIYASRDYFK